jgi:hypothetical protein
MPGGIGPGTAYEIRAFRFKQGIPGVGEAMRVTHFAAFPACALCHTIRCGCRRPDTVTMLCGAQYDRRLLDEIIRGDEAGMPHIYCHARAIQLESESAAAESSVAPVVDGTVIAGAAPLSGAGQELADCGGSSRTAFGHQMARFVSGSEAREPELYREYSG